MPAAERHPRRAAGEDMWCSELILRMVVPHIEWDYLQTGTMPLTLLLLWPLFPRMETSCIQLLAGHFEERSCLGK